MSLNEQYLLYTYATELVKNHHFKVFYLNEKLNEVWLERKENRSTQIVRLIHKDFDWKNHLKQDIGFLFQRITAVRKMFGKNIEIYNLYFATHPPVDSWETLKKPLQTQGKLQMKMKVYYFDESEYSSETERLQEDLLDSPIDYDLELPNEDKEIRIDKAKEKFVESFNNKKEELTNIFSYGRPLLTYVLIAINLLIFLITEINGGSTSIETLIQYGAKYNPSILVDGEWWRIVTSMFLHIGALHLILNMIAIYYLGGAVEKIFGSVRFIIIYFLAGIGGSLASFSFNMSVSAGASGAIFGLFGALLYFGISHKRVFFQTMGMSLLFILAINLGIGLIIDGIDMAAHAGGLILGFIAASIVGLPDKRRLRIQVTAVVMTAVILFGLVFYGIGANANSQTYQLQKIQIQIDKNDYGGAVISADEALTLDGDLAGAILFQRAYAYIQLNQYDKALTDLEESITYDDLLPESYYNLALLYQMDGKEEQAIEAITEAYRMNPSNEDFINLYEELTGDSISE